MPEFWERVDSREAAGCWPWLGCLFVTGYGKYKTGYAHRYALADSGVDIEGKFVCHSCDNPACYNPAHLFVGTQKDNMRDMTNKDRQSRGSDRPLAKLTEDYVRVIRGLRGKVTQKELAKRFGVCQAHISRLLKGVQWKHL